MEIRFTSAYARVPWTNYHGCTLRAIILPLEAPERGDQIMAANDCLIVTLAVKVKGHAGLIRADQDDTLEQLKTHRHHFIYSKVAKHHGRIVRETNDLLLIDFESATEAVLCAAELRSSTTDHNIGMSRDWWIFCIGIAMDDVARNSDDLIVRAVAALPTDTPLIKPGSGIYQDRHQTAEWLATFAGPSGICISDGVRNAIGDQLPYLFEQIALPKLDGRTAPVRCYVMRPRSAAPGPLGRQIPYSQAISLRSAGIAASALATVGVWGVALWAWLATNASKAPIPAAVAVDSHIPSIGSTVNGTAEAGSVLQLLVVSAAGNKASEVLSSGLNLFEINSAMERAEQQPQLLLPIAPHSSMVDGGGIEASSLPQTRRDRGIAGTKVFPGTPLLQTALDREGAADRGPGTYWSQLLQNKSEWYETRRRSTEPSQ